MFAVPGHPLDPRAEGTNQLLKSGATIATSAADVLEALSPQMTPAPHWVGEGTAHDTVDDGGGSRTGYEVDIGADGSPNGAQATVLAALGVAPMSVDALARATGMPMRTLQAVVLELTLAERIERHGAQLISLRSIPE